MYRPYQERPVLPKEVSERINIGNPDNVPNIILSISPCRSGTTVLLRVFSAVGIPSYFQPLKNILRWRGLNGDMNWSIQQNSAESIYLKETLGPYTKAEAQFNPLTALLKAGLPPEKLQILIWGRDPFQSWFSWLHWWKGKTTIENFMLTYQTTESIRQQALKLGINVTTAVYEVLRDYPSEKVIQRVFKKLDLTYKPIAVTGWQRLPPFGSDGSNIFLAKEHPLFAPPHIHTQAIHSQQLAYHARDHEEITKLDDEDIAYIKNSGILDTYAKWKDQTIIELALPMNSTTIL